MPDFPSNSSGNSKRFRESVRPSAWVPLVGAAIATIILIVYVPIIVAEPDSFLSHIWVPLLGITVAVLTIALRGNIEIKRGKLLISAFPVWRFAIPLKDIRNVESVHVDAFSDFLGVGLRFGRGGAIGVVMRSGEGVEVTTIKGKRIIMVVPDATAWRERIIESMN